MSNTRTTIGGKINVNFGPLSLDMLVINDELGVVFHAYTPTKKKAGTVKAKDLKVQDDLPFAEGFNQLWESKQDKGEFKSVFKNNLIRIKGISIAKTRIPVLFTKNADSFFGKKYYVKRKDLGKRLFLYNSSNLRGYNGVFVKKSDDLKNVNSWVYSSKDEKKAELEKKNSQEAEAKEQSDDYMIVLKFPESLQNGGELLLKEGDIIPARKANSKNSFYPLYESIWEFKIDIEMVATKTSTKMEPHPKYLAKKEACLKEEKGHWIKANKDSPLTDWDYSLYYSSILNWSKKELGEKTRVDLILAGRGRSIERWKKKVGNKSKSGEDWIKEILAKNVVADWNNNNTVPESDPKKAAENWIKEFKKEKLAPWLKKNEGLEKGDWLYVIAMPPSKKAEDKFNQMYPNKKKQKEKITQEYDHLIGNDTFGVNSLQFKVKHELTGAFRRKLNKHYNSSGSIKITSNTLGIIQEKLDGVNTEIAVNEKRIETIKNSIKAINCLVVLTPITLGKINAKIENVNTSIRQNEESIAEIKPDSEGALNDEQEELIKKLSQELKELERDKRIKIQALSIFTTELKGEETAIKNELIIKKDKLLSENTIVKEKNSTLADKEKKLIKEVTELEGKQNRVKEEAKGKDNNVVALIDHPKLELHEDWQEKGKWKFPTIEDRVKTALKEFS
ncbi:MAG: hypothetical protein JKY48_18800 [Flavobacteriales bacterium]|nr:hypothetical protein [Flavobacteriales bacterium]